MQFQYNPGRSTSGSNPHPRRPHGRGHARRRHGLSHRSILPPPHLPRLLPPTAAASSRQERTRICRFRGPTRANGHAAHASLGSQGLLLEEVRNEEGDADKFVILDKKDV